MVFVSWMLYDSNNRKSSRVKILSLKPERNSYFILVQRYFVGVLFFMKSVKWLNDKNAEANFDYGIR